MPDDRPILWTPSPERAASTRIAGFERWLQDNRGLSFASYQEMWEWSVTDLDGFWTWRLDTTEPADE